YYLHPKTLRSLLNVVLRLFIALSCRCCFAFGIVICFAFEIVPQSLVSIPTTSLRKQEQISEIKIPPLGIWKLNSKILAEFGLSTDK
ncbi:hypothetical protein PIB30_109362, partial [Stylosanthes scabra]|nr:hypothetical protein [Stylosanthes scabra]